VERPQRTLPKGKVTSQFRCKAEVPVEQVWQCCPGCVNSDEAEGRKMERWQFLGVEHTFTVPAGAAGPVEQASGGLVGPLFPCNPVSPSQEWHKWRDQEKLARMPTGWWRDRSDWVCRTREPETRSPNLKSLLRQWILPEPPKMLAPSFKLSLLLYNVYICNIYSALDFELQNELQDSEWLRGGSGAGCPRLRWHLGKCTLK
jgi:hypothetical protein